MERDFTVVFRVRPSFSVSAQRADGKKEGLISIAEANEGNNDAGATTTSVIVREPRTRLSLHPSSSAPSSGGELTSDYTQHTFNADNCYLSASTTESIFATHVAPLIPFVLSGGHTTVLAYGQTGSGKTHTLSTLSRLAILSLYSANAASISTTAGGCDISISAIELYGKTKINDLFDPTNSKIIIGESIHGGSVFSRATVKTGIATGEDMVKEVEAAWGQRVTRGTEKNPYSSRSHALIRINCQKRGDKNAVPGVLQLVDLAGSERASDWAKPSPFAASANANAPSKAEKEAEEKELSQAARMAETVAINTSLMTLKQCILSRTSQTSSNGGEAGGPPHIPFRSSKLTLALKEAFDLYSRQPTHTLFIATASPEAVDLPATLNTFRYASALLAAPHSRIELQPDPLDRNVFFWSPERLSQWLLKYAPPVLRLNEDSVGKVVQGEDGLRFSKVPEQTFVSRLEAAFASSTKSAATGWGKKEEGAAKELYLKWWKLIIASRTLSQKASQDEWKKRSTAKKAQEEKEERESKDVQEVLMRLKLGGASAAAATATV